jgi:FAD/FMN-containing dehydrogenase
LAGATLHGGFGLLSRRHGWGSDNVLAFDVVTGDGEFRTVTPDTDPDLDWAMRGAGSSFGVVTSMVVKLHEIPPELTFGSLYFPADRWSALLPRIAGFLRILPDDDGLYALVKVASAEDGLSEEWTGRAVIDLVLTHFGSEDSARRLVDPMLADPSLIHAHIVSANFKDLHFRAPQRASAMPGRQAWDEEFVSDLTPEVGEVLARAAAAMETAPGTAIMQIYPRRSGMARPPAFPSCSGLHATGFTLSAWGVWEDPKDDAKGDRWIEDFIADARRAGGNGRIYLNAVSNIDAARARRAFGEDVYARLMNLKRKYDPEGMFRGLLQ